jgi:hypothetical protein
LAQNNTTGEESKSGKQAPGFQLQAVLESVGGAKKKPTFLRGGLL